MAMVDVTIRGAGVFGLSIAWVCALKGAKVQVIDPSGIAGGASGGIVGALAPHVPENWNPKKAFQLDALLIAEAFWNEVDQASGMPSGYGRTGRLQPLLNDNAVNLARARADTAKVHWQDHATWKVIPARSVAQALASPTGLFVHDTLSARIHPRNACHSLATACKSLGVQFFEDAPDVGVVCEATGWAGLVAYSKRSAEKVGDGIKGQAALFDLDLPGPQLFVDGLHIIGHSDGTTAVGSTSEREFEHEKDTDAQLDQLILRAKAILPSLQNADLLERWAGVRPRAKSRAPLIGRLPSIANRFVANGGFKIGFAMAPKVGQLMAELMLEGHADIPPEFDAELQMAFD